MWVMFRCLGYLVISTGLWFLFFTRKMDPPSLGGGITPSSKTGSCTDKSTQSQKWTQLTLMSWYNQCLHVCSVTSVACKAATQPIKARDRRARVIRSGQLYWASPPSLPSSLLHELTRSCAYGPAPALIRRSPQLRGTSILSSMLRSSKM